MARKCTTQRHQDHPPPDGPWLSQQRLRVENRARVGSAYESLVTITAQLVEPLTVFPNQPGGSGDRARGGGIHTVQLRQDPVPDSIARVGDVVVCFVIDPGLSSRFQKRAQFQSRHVEHWPDDFAALRMNGRQPRQTGSTYELQQKGLRLIVARVADRNPIGVRRNGRAMEEVVTQSARRVFNRVSLCRGVSGDIDRFDLDRQVDRLRKRATHGLIAIGRGSKPMIQVRETNDVESAVLGQLTEDQRERDRIRTAGQADQYAASGRTETVTLNGATNLLMKSRHSMPNAQCPMLKKPSRFHEKGSLGTVHWALCIDMPEGGLEPPTPRL
jgi:hypothetical protein